MMARTATITGLTKLQRKLDRLPAVAKDHIRSEMEQAADEIVAMMKSLVPVDDGVVRASIGWTWGKAPQGSLVIAAMKGAGIGGDLSITIYAGGGKAYYAKWVEFGVKPKAKKDGSAPSSGKRQTGQPFFYVSWRANRKNARRRVRKAVREAARQVASQ